MADNTPLLISNDVFRFASVRAINTHSSDALERRYISLDKDGDANKIKEKYQNARLLVFNMNNFVNQYKSYSTERLRGVIDEIKNTNKFILTPEKFARDYPENFDSVYEWSRTTSKVDINGLTTQINKVLGKPKAKDNKPIEDFLEDKSYVIKKFKLYETLIAYYLVPEPAYFLDVINQTIKWYWIMQRIAAPDNYFAIKLPDDAQAIKEALNATIILPFKTDRPKSAEPAEEPLPPKEKEKTEREIAQDRLKDLNHAESEITEKYKVQIIDEKHAAKYCEEQNKKTNLAGPDENAQSKLMASRYVGGLSDKTHGVIDSYRIPKTEGLDTEHVLGRINLERKSIVQKYYQRPQPPVMFEVNGRFIQVNEPCNCGSDDHETCIPYKYDPCAKYPHIPIQYKKTQMRTPGWADLKVIKSTLLKYEKGEIAHIENVLKGEVKVREFNVTKRTEESLFTEEEVTSETEKENQSTDRFELEKEISQQSKEEMKFDTGVKVSAKLGPVQLDTHLDFAYNTSRDDSTKTSTKNSQEMMNRALSKLIERKKTQRTVTTIVTTEDKNSHTLENKQIPNAPAPDNIHGMYFWVDKYYLAKVVNYDARFMLEFMVPEPAAFYIYSKANKPQPSNVKVKPEFPQIMTIGGGDNFTPKYRKIESFQDINTGNYAELAAEYNAQDVAPPPSERTVITTSIKHDKPFAGEHDSEDDHRDLLFVETNKELIVPDGYTALSANVTWQDFQGAGSKNPELPWYISILVGDEYNDNPMSNPKMNIPLNGEDRIVPFSVAGVSRHFVANVEVICSLTDKKKDEWRKNTFNSIMTGYYKQLAEYEDWQKEQEVNSGISIQGDNPEINRQVEKEELKKHCIQLMTGQDFSSFNAVDNNVAPLGYPEINSDQAFEEGKEIQYFEQAFEWEQMTYVFYPYFWGRKPNWVMIKSINDTDPVFTSFLQAGAARVLVPTRPGFEDSVVNFLAGLGTWNDPKIWTGTNPPIPDDKLWISVVDELKEKQGQFKGGREDGEPWIYKIPTSLVYLEETKTKLEDTDLSAKYPNDLQKIEDAKTSADFS